MTSSTYRRPTFPKVTCDLPHNRSIYDIRKSAGIVGATQETFANAIGVSVRTYRNWEQGRRKPTGSGRILLSLIARDPYIVFDVTSDRVQGPCTGAPLAQ